MPGGARRAIWSLAVLAVTLGGAQEPGEIRLEPERDQATVGERIPLRLVVDLPADLDADPRAALTPGRTLGPCALLDGRWDPEPQPAGGRRIWTWRGGLACYRTGDQELPALRWTVEGPGGPVELASTPRTIGVVSVLDDEDPAQADLSEIKRPASIAPDRRALYIAAGLLAVLLLAAALVWWIQRRYAARFAAVAAPSDPFHRTPPHVWVYAELQRLLERRLAEQGEIDLFFSELARILKRYLGGRYRVELMERTTGEIAAPLLQAGAPDASVDAVLGLLGRCDRVKFAGEQPPAEQCRAAVDEAYRIVDATKPAVAVEPAPAAVVEEAV